MEMPVDVLNRRLGRIRDNGDIDFDNTAVAVDIDSELQDKFLFFPIEELEEDGAAIEDDRGVLHAGTGPEHCQARPGENPNWLLSHARNALTLYWRLKQLEEAEKLAKRPAPGVYHTQGSGRLSFTAIVTEDRRVVVPMEDGVLLDQSVIFDAHGWKMRPIDVANGTIRK